MPDDAVKYVWGSSDMAILAHLAWVLHSLSDILFQMSQWFSSDTLIFILLNVWIHILHKLNGGPKKPNRPQLLTIS